MNQKELTHSLRKEAILKGHSVKTIASGYSMFPFLRKGDLLTVEPVSIDSVKRGDIVVSELNETWIAHRVIKIASTHGRTELTTRGDARMSIDPRVVKENYIGVVSYLERDKKNISLISLRKKTSTQIHLLGGKLLSFLLNYLARKKH
jgi:signal peptidase I